MQSIRKVKDLFVGGKVENFQSSVEALDSKISEPDTLNPACRTEA